MRDPGIEGKVEDSPAVLQHVDMAEVVPEAKGDRRQQETTAAATPVFHGIIAVMEGGIAHMEEIMP